MCGTNHESHRASICMPRCSQLKIVYRVLGVVGSQGVLAPRMIKSESSAPIKRIGLYGYGPCTRQRSGQF